MIRLLFQAAAGFAFGVALLAGVGFMLSNCDANSTWGVLAGRVFDTVNSPLAAMLRGMDVEQTMRNNQDPGRTLVALGLWWGCLGIGVAFIVAIVRAIGRRGKA